MNRRSFSVLAGAGALALASVSAETEAQGQYESASGAAALPRSGAGVDSRARGGHGRGGASAGRHLRRDERKGWAREHFRGFENVLMPSFTPDLKHLDEAGIRLDVRNSIAHGFFSSLCSCIGLTSEEAQQFVGIATDEAQGRISISFAEGAEGPEKHDLALIRHAEKVGCSHMLLDLPRTGSAESLIRITRELSESTSLGIYLWAAQVHDFKRFHPSAIPFPVFDAVADLPNIIALKIGYPDPAAIFEAFTRYKDRMLIGALMLDIMPFGIKGFGQQWSGAWTVEALQTPKNPHAVEFFRSMMGGEYERGMQLYWTRLLPAFGAMMKVLGPLMPRGGHPWEYLKLYQFLGGGNGGRMRPDPAQTNLIAVTQQDMDRIKGVFRAVGLEPDDLPLEAFEVGRTQYEHGVRRKDLLT